MNTELKYKTVTELANRSAILIKKLEKEGCTNFEIQLIGSILVGCSASSCASELIKTALKEEKKRGNSKA